MDVFYSGWINHVYYGDSYSEFFLFLTWTYLQVVPFCSLISKLFLVFAVGHFLPFAVKFFGFNGNFNDQWEPFWTPEKRFLAILLILVIFPLKPKIFTDSRRKGRTSKTKAVLKIGDQMEQLETM